MARPKATPAAEVEMEDEAVFRRQLDLFVRSSTEKRIELVRLGELLAELPRRRGFLDVGAGGGDLTVPLSQAFRSTCVVEPGERQAALLALRHPDFEVLHSDFLSADLGDRRFDLVLCSHVLYYIPEARWAETVARMHALLEPGGVLAIVLQSPLGEVADFFNAFTRYDVDVEGLWKTLIETYGDERVKAAYFRNEIWTESVEDMAEIGLFLLLDRRFRQRKAAIADWFETRHRRPGGCRLFQDEILLSVRN